MGFSPSAWRIGLLPVTVGLALFLVAPSLLIGCHPALPEPGDWGAGGSPTEEGVITAELEPSAPLEGAPPVVRMHVAVPAGVADANGFVVATGELGPGHLRQLADGDLSGALTERLLPSRTWMDSSELGAVVHVAPAVLLEPGERYTVACGEPKLAFSIDVVDEPPWPLLRRTWPPVGASATADFGVWCGDPALGDAAGAVRLAPNGARGTMRTGVAPGMGLRCVRFEADEPAAGDAAQVVPFDDAPIAVGWLPPPIVDIAGAAVLLEPSPLAAEVPPPGPVPPRPCDAELPLAFGSGCAALFDDRLLARAPDARLLWAIHGEGLDLVVDVPAGASLTVTPLPPSSDIMLSVLTIDSAGIVAPAVFGGRTAAPMPHVVLNEVLANPLGAEPQQEWVELYNSGLAAADLAGYLLEDVGGVTPLPEATLDPGQLALVVGEGFVEDDLLDPPVPAGALLLRVAKVGKNGLSNSGEPVTLRDADGRVVSRFPPVPKPKAGLSVARVHPLAPDDGASSYTHTVPTPAAPN